MEATWIYHQVLLELGCYQHLSAQNREPVNPVSLEQKLKARSDFFTECVTSEFISPLLRRCRVVQLYSDRLIAYLSTYSR